MKMGRGVKAETMDDQNIRLYESGRMLVKEGDVLLFRCDQGLLAKLISVAGRSPYIHAGLAVWWEGRLLCLETVQGRGARISHLSALLRSYDGVLVRRVKVRFNRKAAVGYMRDLIGKPYGWWSLARATLLHCFLWRFLVTPDLDDKANSTLPFCSQAVAAALRAGGVDPVPNLADRLTEPGDLARSAALVDKFILV